jgi:hypothetical protein
MTEAKTQLTVDDVHGRIAEIAKIVDAGNNEVAHGEEDRLWEDVLEAIADGHEQPRALAIAALSTCELDFARWYA